MPIDNLPPIRDVLKQSNLFAKKSLGQNFLYDLNLTTKIANLNGSLVDTNILEIGPGPGALTRAILASGAKKVFVVEKDNSFIPILQDISKVYPNRLEIIEEDALKFDLMKLQGISNLKIISNLPYNIGTKLLSKWLEPRVWPPIWTDMTLMFQKEVANRIVASHGSRTYGRLSVLAQWRNTVKIKMNVPPNAFKPIPKVNSSVVSFYPDKIPKYKADEYTLRRIVKSGFLHRRKMLRSSLKYEHPEIERILQLVDIKPTLRAENLSINDWCNLSKAVKQNS